MFLANNSVRIIAVLAGLLLGTPSADAVGNVTTKASLHNFFTQGVTLQGAKAELVNVLRWPVLKRGSKGELRWHLPRLRNHPMRVSLIVEQGKDEGVRRWYVPVQLRWWADALVVRDDVAAHTLITASMLKSVRVNVADHAGHWWTDARQLEGTRTTRPLRAGQVLYTSYVKRPPLLQRGDRIVLVARARGVKVTAIGEVLKSAGRGDKVRVRNLSSKRMLQATVIDKYTARVLVGGLF